MEPDRVRVERHERLSVVCFPRGRVDGNTVRELFETAMALTASPPPRLVVDLTGVPLASSGLMGILVQIHKRYLQAGGRMVVAVSDERIRGAFEVANLHQLLGLYATMDDASQAVLA
jgi:anti-anti-sigma factor